MNLIDKLNIIAEEANDENKKTIQQTIKILKANPLPLHVLHLIELAKNSGSQDLIEAAEKVEGAGYG